MIQPQVRIAAFSLAAALTLAVAAPAEAQTSDTEKVSRAPDGTAFTIELYPEKYDTDYLRALFGHLFYLAPSREPKPPADVLGQLLDGLGQTSSLPEFMQTPEDYCLYRAPGAPELEKEAWERVGQRGIKLSPVNTKQRSVVMRSGECVLITVAALPPPEDEMPESLSRPIIEVEQHLFETEERFVVLRGQVTAAAGLGPLYLDKEPIPYDRETGRIKYRLAMPEPGQEETRNLFTLDQRQQESATIRIVLRRVDIPPPRIHDYTEVVKSEAEVGKVYGYVASRRPLDVVTVDGTVAKLDRDSGYFEAAVAMPDPGEPRRTIVVEAYDIEKRHDAARVALIRIVPAPPPEDIAPPMIIADRTTISTPVQRVEVSGRVESKLAIAAVRVGDRLAELEGRNFRATVDMPAPLDGATLLVTAADVEGNRAEPVRIALERLPWCPAGLLAPGEEVRGVQESLNRQGYDAGAVDGLFGRKTAAALDAFWRREVGEKPCSREELIAALAPPADDGPPPPEDATEVTEIPAPPPEDEPQLEPEIPAAQESQPQAVEEALPPSLRFEDEPITAWQASTTVRGHALGDMAGWRLVFNEEVVPVAADGSFRIPVDGLACGINRFQALLVGPDGGLLPNRFAVRRSSSLGSWYCHAAGLPPWLWLLPLVLLLLAVAPVAKRRRSRRPAGAARLRLETSRDADFTAEVLPGPQLRLALRLENEINTTEVVAPAPPVHLKEVGR